MDTPATRAASESGFAAKSDIGDRWNDNPRRKRRMSVALFALADASISELKKNLTKKPPPKRTATATPDSTLVAEPR